MIKILVADDEMLVRIGIKSLVDWTYYGFEVVGDAEDGATALRLMEQCPPDILLTDIVMPNMDGLDLIRAVRQRFPYVHILVLSCHSDYEYVRLALKLGASDYILKTSMRPDSLLATMQEIKSRMLAAPQAQAPAAPSPQEVIGRLVMGEAVPPQAINGLRAQGGPMALACARIHHASMPGRDAMTAIRSLHNLIDQGLAPHLGDARIHGENEIVLLLRCDDMEKVLAQLDQDVARAQRLMRLPISFGVSAPFADVKRCPVHWAQARAALAQSFYAPQPGVFCYRAAQAADEHLLAREHKVFSAILSDQAPGRLPQYVRALSDRIQKQQPAPTSARQLYLDLYACMAASAKVAGLAALPDEGDIPPYQLIQSFDFFHQLRGWMGEAAAAYDAALSDAGQQISRREIERLTQYMQANYRKNLTLPWAAGYVHMSESYLSRVFKQQTGEGFIEYLTNLRIDRAKALLRTTSMLSYEIADQVGYPNANYFGRIFKKVTGISPNAYRARKGGPSS